MHQNAFAERLALVLLGEVIVAGLHRFVPINRPGQLRQCMWRNDQRLHRRALDGAFVLGREMTGKSAEAFPWIDVSHHTFSNARETPWPTPTHIVASARLPPRLCKP